MEQNTQFTIQFSDLKDKEVVNAADGAMLGHISDLELDPEIKTVRALLLPQPGRFFHFSRRDMLRIPLEHIERIGEDIILVRTHSLKSR